MTTDITTGGRQYDILTTGNYEVPIRCKQGRLVPLEFDAAYDVDDILPAIRGGLSVDGNLYAAPFYGESAFLMHRTDLLEATGPTMPESPTWESSARQRASSPTARPTSTASACAARLPRGRTWR